VTAGSANRRPSGPLCRDLDSDDRSPARRIYHTRGQCHAVKVSRCQVSRRLTPLVPQPRHRTANACRFPSSEGFDRMFRNEEVAGSNPASSTNAPVRALSALSNAAACTIFVVRCPTHAPQDACPDHLAGDEVLITDRPIRCISVTGVQADLSDHRGLIRFGRSTL
jgi:hypothetical protein